MESDPAPPGVATAQFNLADTAICGLGPLLRFTTLMSAGGDCVRSRMAPALDPPPCPAVKATRARPLTGLIPTATGAKERGTPVESAEGKLSSAVTVGTPR